jgi:hypothetical protein
VEVAEQETPLPPPPCTRTQQLAPGALHVSLVCDAILSVCLRTRRHGPAVEVDHQPQFHRKVGRADLPRSTCSPRTTGLAAGLSTRMIDRQSEPSDKRTWRPPAFASQPLSIAALLMFTCRKWFPAALFALCALAIVFCNVLFGRCVKQPKWAKPVVRNLVYYWLEESGQLPKPVVVSISISVFICC